MSEQLGFVEAVDEYLDEHSWLIKHIIYEVDGSFSFVAYEMVNGSYVENSALPDHRSRLEEIIKERAEKMKKEKYNE